MENNELKNKLTVLLKLYDWSEEQRNAFYVRTGKLLLDAAVGKLLLTLSDEEVNVLDKYMATLLDADDLVLHLLETYPMFESILQTEAESFCSEAETVLQ